MKKLFTTRSSSPDITGLCDILFFEVPGVFSIKNTSACLYPFFCFPPFKILILYKLAFLFTLKQLIITTSSVSLAFSDSAIFILFLIQ